MIHSSQTWENFLFFAELFFKAQRFNFYKFQFTFFFFFKQSILSLCFSKNTFSQLCVWYVIEVGVL